MVTLEAEYAAAHAARNAERELLAKQVQDLFDRRISEAVPPAPATPLAPAAPATPTAATQAAPPVIPRAAAEALPLSTPSANGAGLDALQQAARDAEAMRTRVADLEAQVQRACAVQAAYAQQTTKEVVLSALPEVAVADAAARRLHKRLLAFLERWSQAGEVLPFCLGDLGRCAADEPATAAALKAVLGQYWSAWFAE